MCAHPCMMHRGLRRPYSGFWWQSCRRKRFSRCPPLFLPRDDACSERCMYFTFGMERAASWGEGFPLIPSASAAAPHAPLRSQPVEHLAGPRSKRFRERALEAGFFAKSGFVSRRLHALGYLNAWGPFPLAPALCFGMMQAVSKKGTFLLIFLLHWLCSGGQGTIPAAWASCSPPL